MRGRTFAVFSCLGALMVFATVTLGSPLAAQKKFKGQPSPVLPGKISKPSPGQSPQLATPGGSTVTDRRSDVVTKPARQLRSDSRPATQKPPYLLKAQKKVVPKAAVQPRTDLTYYGVLEDSQRYDPRPNSRTAGVPSPQTSDLTHDHFQELDRNQDGKIDPVERAFGRIDMDRDLPNRQLQ